MGSGAAAGVMMLGTGGVCVGVCAGVGGGGSVGGGVAAAAAAAAASAGFTAAAAAEDACTTGTWASESSLGSFLISSSTSVPEYGGGAELCHLAEDERLHPFQGLPALSLIQRHPRHQGRRQAHPRAGRLRQSLQGGALVICRPACRGQAAAANHARPWMAGRGALNEIRKIEFSARGGR